MTAGRPTDYKEEYCNKVIDLGKETKDHNPMSYTQIAVELHVIRNTLYVWANKYPDFKDALVRARESHQKWFEEQLQNGFWDTTEKETDGSHSTMSSRRLNCNVAKLYAYMNFGISEKSADDKQAKNILSEYYHNQTTLERKRQILDECLMGNSLSASVYKTMNDVLDQRFGQDNGLSILEADARLKEREDKASKIV